MYLFYKFMIQITLLKEKNGPIYLVCHLKHVINPTPIHAVGHLGKMLRIK